MKTVHLILVLFVLFFIDNGASAQNSKVFQPGNEYVTFEKIYLHIDREFYFIGETIWFKAYLLDGQNLSSVADTQNLYIDLIDSEGRIAQNQVLICENGEASGSILIPDSSSTGTFMIRAYTDFLKNFGEETFFHKPLKISEVKSSIDLEAEKSKLHEGKPRIDISFFPEGGYLLAGTKNLVAFKAIDESGKGVSINGKVLDGKGETVSSFKTYYNGMGRMFLFPMKGKSYKVEIDGYPDFEYSFNDILNKGVKLQLLGQTKDELAFGIVSNSSRYSVQSFYLACFCRGKLLFHKAIGGSLLPLKIVVETDLMQQGINRFILFDENLEPVSERMVFSDNMNVNNLEVKTNLQEYPTRSQVQLDILDEIDNLGCSNLSVAIINENALNTNRGSQNILSFLLLDSELKGFIPSPADYFYDDSLTSQAKLNLLMLTHGWSRYLRNTPEMKDINIKYPKTAGISIKGRAEKITGKKPIVGGKITLGIFKENSINWLEGETDSKGRFSFDNIVVFDTAKIIVQALNERERQKSEIFLDTVFEKEPAVSSDILDFMSGFQDIPLELYRQQYYSELAQREFSPDDNTILLEEVEIKGKKTEKEDGHFRIYQNADHVLEVTSENISHVDVIRFLQGRVPGLVISGDNVFFLRSTSSLTRTPTPLFLIDGFPTGGSQSMSDDAIPDESVLSLVRSIPMSTIDKVEILRGNSAAIYGSRAANGVIAIYTRKGLDPIIPDDLLKGVITEQIVGYSSYREFYSPKYTPENIDSPQPDFRTTLYWNPDITTEYGKAGLNFFTSDDFSYYRVIVEGVMDNGDICLGTARFTVNRRNLSLDDFMLEK